VKDAAPAIVPGFSLSLTAQLEGRWCVKTDSLKGIHQRVSLGNFDFAGVTTSPPKMVFADRTTFRRNAQFDVEVGHLIESLAAHGVRNHKNLMRIFAV